MASGFIPKGLWYCGFKLRTWIRQEAKQAIPQEVEEWIEHYEELAVVANEVDEARREYKRAVASMARFGKEVSPAILKKVDRDRAQIEIALSKLSRHLNSKGPAQPRKSNKRDNKSGKTSGKTSQNETPKPGEEC